MSTRGNVLFASNFYMNDNNIKTEDIENNTRILEGVIENAFKIYVHSDMYPSGALRMLTKYLRLDGAKRRAHDTSYLAAWFVGFKCMHMIPYTRAFFSDERIEPNKIRKTYGNMEKSKDFFGVGLLKECASDADYNYIIVPKLEEENRNYYNYQNSCDILIFDWNFKHLATINSEDNLETFKEENWWH